jgi:hypothetical protein
MTRITIRPDTGRPDVRGLPHWIGGAIIDGWQRSDGSADDLRATAYIYRLHAKYLAQGGAGGTKEEADGYRRIADALEQLAEEVERG